MSEKEKEKRKKSTDVKRVIEPQVTVEIIHLENFVRGKVEAEKVNVLPLPVGIRALGYDTDVALDVPPQQDLRGRLAVLGGELGDGGVFEQQGRRLVGQGLLLVRQAGTEGLVACHDDVVLVRETSETVLGEVWVDLDLQSGGHDLRIPHHVEDQLSVEVANPNAPCQPVFD